MKYLCIDSNIYRDIFSPSEDFSDEISDLIFSLVKKEGFKLILPNQIKEEVERNRFSSWYESSKSEYEQKIRRADEDIDLIDKKFKKFKQGRSLIKEIRKDKILLERIVRSLESRFRSKKSQANKSLKSIFAAAEILYESPQAMSLAQIRVAKKNPPRDSEESYGDSIIWESLLEYFRNRHPKDKRDELFFVSNDKRAWGDKMLDLWLKDEWGKKTNSKITLFHALSDLAQLTVANRLKIKEEEENSLKDNIINDFISSSSFIEAGKNADRLLNVKDKLNKNDLERIMSASLKNHEIYNSFFTPIPLGKLVCDNDDFFVTSVVEKIDDELWDKFKTRYNIDIMRRKEIPF